MRYLLALVVCCAVGCEKNETLQVTPSYSDLNAALEVETARLVEMEASYRELLSPHEEKRDKAQRRISRLLKEESEESADGFKLKYLKKDYDREIEPLKETVRLAQESIDALEQEHGPTLSEQRDKVASIRARRDSLLP